MDIDNRIPVVLAGVPTNQIVQVIARTLSRAGRTDLLDTIYAQPTPEHVLREMHDYIRQVWEREEEHTA